MSVLACDRKGCENIMCDYYSHRYGYICVECLQELKDNKPTTFQKFMESEKDEPINTNIWEEIVEAEFTLQ